MAVLKYIERQPRIWLGSDADWALGGALEGRSGMVGPGQGCQLVKYEK